MEDGEWIVFEGDVTIDDFVKRNRPSLIENSHHPWVKVVNPQRLPCRIPKEDRHSLLEEWETVKRNPGRITADFVRDLAEKYAYKSGKWLIYSERARIDAIWKSVATAVVSGRLGTAAKVSTRDPEESTHVICVYTEDFTDEEEVRAVEKGLKEVGVTAQMLYKPDIYTTLGIYRNNPWRLKPTIYTSQP
ncbi:hypothetical protein OS493_022632 [Desmophyllum pertusum]|uniref:DUF1917 domain-containing protein n=1 Tax=Desmophyllum pertusum TaxID=174260 RepID=A0A9W9YQ92_9CNID|nr:hypothetical protein OS493_022632 [Desmophyllum pertusum]